MKRVSVFVPGSIGNVGPGFDVLGLAIDGIGDTVTVDLGAAGEEDCVEIRGVHAERIPTEPAKNTASIAARSLLRARGESAALKVTIEKQLPLAGGMGGSAASSVGGAFATAMLLGCESETSAILAAALDGEAAVAGRHLDNIGPSLLGGLVCVVTNDPPDIVRLPLADGWWLALVTPFISVETKAARKVLPDVVDRATFVAQMASTTATAYAFATGDGELMRRALVDRFAEPRRSAMIPGFAAAKKAALEEGAFACTISGAGPTLFAVTRNEGVARAAAGAMQFAFAPLGSSAHVAPAGLSGARAV
ncbi:MAG: homoserine kinase [Thermoanaerobaculia bacterium]